MKISYFVTGLILSGLLNLPAYAVDIKVKTKPETPVTKFETATAEISKGLDENQIKQFAAINNSYGVIKTVEDVQQSITHAVGACSKANPEIKDSISNRFEAWKDAIRPVMKEARTKLNKMILLQGYAQPSEVRGYLKKFDAAIIYRNQSLTPMPIKKLEDCKKLESSMNETQNNLVNLITESLALNIDLKIKE